MNLVFKRIRFSLNENYYPIVNSLLSNMDSEMISKAPMTTMNISIAATFTCHPIENALTFWGEKFGYKLGVNFSPYDQIFQELLDQHSSLNSPDNDARILLIRLDDWIRNLLKTEQSDLHSYINENIRYLIESISTANSYSNAPLFLMITRNSPYSFITPDQLKEFERFIQDPFSKDTSIFVFTSGDIDEQYSVENYYDSQRDQLGHIPYSNEYFSALASSIVRNVLSLKRKPYKVVVLDCDNTLWGGACGELGADGIDLSDPFLSLQRFMHQQTKTGKILCLCSKNVEEDVDSVFADRADMLLKKEDIVSFKINWLPKSQNIRELADELNLGLDSFIFIDDNPVECAEVRANCPEVLTLNLPENPVEIPDFLNHVWAFDTLKTTSEDKGRTQLYQENIKRTTFQKVSSSLKEFIDGLNLEISIKDPAPDEISRVSQLTYRTNQFNFTTIRRSEEEIKDLISGNDFECKVCRVKDRFGDYGLVGVMLYQKTLNRIILDSFMLSCRVLGRGVEHQMLKFIGEATSSAGSGLIQINFQKTEKNLPALNFLESIIKEFLGDVLIDQNGYILPADYLSSLVYNPEKTISGQIKTDHQEIKSVNQKFDDTGHLIFEEIAKNLNSAAKINQLLHTNGHSGIESSIFSEKKASIEIVTEIWEEILGITGVGSDQHFFDVGGTSLKAVEVLSQLNQRFNKNLTIVSLFEHSTIRSLAELVDGKPVENHEFSKILQRAGSRRDRYKRKN